MQRELVVRAQAGDVEAFTGLARDTVDRLHGVVYRILRDSDGAGDAARRAMIAAWITWPICATRIVSRHGWTFDL